MESRLDVIINNIQGKIVTISPIDLKEKNVIGYKDARSGVFYAMGESMKENTPITLLVPGEYISSTYTAITEAWFQKVNVVVVALYEKISDVNTTWMERCLVANATFGIDEESAIHTFLEKAYGMKGPVLVNVVGETFSEHTCDYEKIINVLESVLTYEIEFWCYNPKHKMEINRFHAIEAQHKYGVISKYIGMSVVSDVGILLCNVECALVDINVFRTRYANSNMKIILVDDGLLKKNDVAHWIESNDWACKEIGVIDEDAAKWLVSQTKQAVLIVG